MVLKELIFHSFPFGRCGGLETLIFIVSMLGGCGGLKRTDFYSFHFAWVW